MKRKEPEPLPDIPTPVIDAAVDQVVRQLTERVEAMMQRLQGSQASHLTTSEQNEIRAETRFIKLGIRRFGGEVKARVKSSIGVLLQRLQEFEDELSTFERQREIEHQPKSVEKMRKS